MKEYEDLLEEGISTATLNSILALLTWDQEIYMPKGAIDARSSQVAYLSHLIHEKRTSHLFKERLEKLISLNTGEILIENLSSHQKAALKEWRKDYLKQTKLPASFVKKLSETSSSAIGIWAKARKENDFDAFSPILEKLIDLNRQKADILGYNEHPYDALIDLYEPGMTTRGLEKLFSSLEKRLSSLVKSLLQKEPIDDSFLYTTYDREKQILFGNIILDELNIDRQHMRLDESVHPFSIAMHPDDSRITTRIEEKNFISNIFSILHEIGHGLYELNLPKEYFGTPLCEATSLGIHESQSRFWETRIGKSLGFWNHFYPLLQNTFSKQLDGISLDKFYKAINAVKPNLIRVESDEVSYCLHVLLRFDIEKALMEKSIQVKDLPHVWNEKMKELLDITPQTNTEGVLQDIHWACGDLGYFPTYALGNLYASHFFKGFEKKHNDWEKKISKGNFEFVKEFVKENIHKHGRYYSQTELAQNITGSGLSDDAYIEYLEKKYHKIYSK